MRRLERFPVGEHNSLYYWMGARNPFSVTKNMVLMKLARGAPLTVKNVLYRLIGIRLGRHVRVALDASFDIFFPELIEIGDETIIGYNATVLSHEFLQKEWRRGATKIGKRVLVGANATILAGVTIGDNATVSAMTLVDRDVPAGAFAHGNPMRIKRKK
ncbi:MAG: acyltransferase [Candidatus Aenigmatarchaeota archaeon]|nr:MAG: acyltransferase [Candidatus Aenigmarchaeota archaeon]